MTSMSEERPIPRPLSFLSTPPRPTAVWHFILIVAYLLVPVSLTAFRHHDTGRSAQSHTWQSLTYYSFLLSILLFLLTWFGLRLRRIHLKEISSLSWRNQHAVAWSWRSVIFIVLANFAIGALLLFDTPSNKGHIFPVFTTLMDLTYATFGALTAGVLEEFVFRGYLLRQFELWTGNLLYAAVLQAILFSLAHGFDQSVLGYMEKFASGMLFACAAIRYGSLLPVMLAHFIFDASLFGMLFLISHH